MVFASPIYLFCFFPCVFLLSRVVPGRRGRVWLLCAGGLLFYAFAQPRHVLLLLVTALLHYLLARRMCRSPRPGALCAVGILYDLALLFSFKYAAFFVSVLNAVSGLSLSLPSLVQPAGLSFFTFQAMAYLWDVQRGRSGAEEDFISLLLYLSFFPRLIAGPLVRFEDHAAQLSALRFTADDTAAGLRRFILGLGKKVLLADILAAAGERLLGGSGALSAPCAWLGAATYALRLYFDFSGYSDMAIGMGRIFGFRFPENFDRPYIACTLTEFWRRWHMTLSGWFRDYVYIPLGGSRRGRGRTALNKLFVFLLTGLWHGAGWNFLLWGLWHGMFMMAESALQKPLERLQGSRAGRFALHGYTLLVVLLGFVLFRAPTLSEALRCFAGLFRAGDGGALRLLTGTERAALLLAVPLSVCPRLPQPDTARRELLWDAGALALLILSLAAMAGGSFTPFIYAQF